MIRVRFVWVLSVRFLFGSVKVQFGLLLSGSVRFLAKSRFWFGSSLLGSSSFPSLVYLKQEMAEVAVITRTLKHVLMKKALRETQTLRAGCSKVEPKFFAPSTDPLPVGAGRPKFNQLEMVTTFTYKPSLVRIDARTFELSW